MPTLGLGSWAIYRRIQDCRLPGHITPRRANTGQVSGIAHAWTKNGGFRFSIVTIVTIVFDEGRSEDRAALQLLVALFRLLALNSSCL